LLIHCSGAGNRPNLTFALPHGLITMFDAGTEKDLFGYAYPNGTSAGMLRGPCGKFGNPAACSPFPMNQLLRYNYSKIVPNTKQKTGEWVISPYIAERTDPAAVNIEIAENMRKFGQAETLDFMGSYQFHDFIVSNVSGAKLSYTLQWDNTTATQYCSAITNNVLGDCRTIIPSGMMNFVHNLVGLALTGNTFITTRVAVCYHTTQHITKSNLY